MGRTIKIKLCGIAIANNVPLDHQVRFPSNVLELDLCEPFRVSVLEKLVDLVRSAQYLNPLSCVSACVLACKIKKREGGYFGRPAETDSD